MLLEFFYEEVYKEKVIGSTDVYTSDEEKYNFRKGGVVRGGQAEMDLSKLKCEYLNGAYNDFANLLGMDAVLKIHAAYRGQQITFPVELFSKEFIALQIVNEYNGYNVKQLETKFGYSEKWIRKILKDHIDKQED